MTYNNVKIVGTGIYHPEKEIHNEYFINHFKKKDIDVSGILNHLGRNVRYHIDNDNENIITMVVESAKRAIENADIDIKDISMIVFVSDTPQYTMPMNALVVQNALGAKNANLVYDMNSNCIAMVSALDIVSNYMMQKHDLEYALIVGGEMMSKFANENDPVLYPTNGDGAASIVLKKVKENVKKGFINACYHADSSLNDKIRFPACGFSNIFNDSIEISDKKVSWIQHDVSYFSDEWKKLITKLLKENDMDSDQIDHFLFSQFSKADIIATLEKLDVPMDRATFIADKYGYTGCTSPMFALHHALNENKINSEDSNIVFCSVGSGYSMVAALYQF